jgi:antitoxin component YwqK of YwqJK toxin-antitoxin module
LKESPFEEMFLRLILNLMMLEKGVCAYAIMPVVIILTIAVVLSVGCYRAFASGNMTSENPPTPPNATNTEKTPPRSCDEWWSPSSGSLPDCPTKDNRSPKSFSENTTADGTVIKTSIYPNGDQEVETITPGGDVNSILYSNGSKNIQIAFDNPNEKIRTIIIDDEGRKPYAILPKEAIGLEKKPDGYSGKQHDGTNITYYRDPTIGNPSSGNWVTETKATDGKVTTISRNNDRSFTIVTKSPDRTVSTTIQKRDGTNMTTDSRGITTTTDPSGNWFITYPKSPDGSTKIYYSNGTTVIQKPNG